jgi:CheY-like chemotaxis protein
MEQRGTRRRHSVLVVDDDVAVRDLFVDALGERGHAVSVATDGTEALQVLRQGRVPCVVLSDLRMPRMDGFELSRAIAGDPQLSAVPVVVVTGDRILSFTSPARDKPFSVAELDALVQSSCALHRAAPRRQATG